MTPDCASPSLRPPWGLFLWADQNTIFAEVPAADPSLPPLIMKFAKNEGGLSKALAMLATRFTKADPNLTVRPVKEHPVKREKQVFTADQRAKALQTLKRLRVL